MATLLTDLVSYWALDEASGNAVDSHGSNTLTETGGTIASTTGKVSNARDFEAGDTEHFAIADNASLSAAGVSLTISAWVRLESKPANNMDIVSKYETTGNQREYRLYWDNVTDRFLMTITTDGTVNTGKIFNVTASNFGAPSLSTWYHIIGWYDFDRQTLNIQVNGGVPNSAAASSIGIHTGIFDGTSPFHIGCIGRSAAGLNFDGLIDEVCLWKRKLTHDERTYLYNSGSGRAYADLNVTPTITAPCGELSTDGIWTWFNAPKPYAYSGKVYLGTFPRSSQKGKVVTYDVAAGTATSIELGSAIGETDDHNDPAVLRLASGKIFAAWSVHNGDSYCAKTTSADDTSAWDSVVTVQTAAEDAYCQVFQVGDPDDTLMWFFRRTSSGNYRPHYFRTSDDEGATWGTPVQFFDVASNRPYFRFWQTSSTRIDFAVNDGNPPETVNSLYHGYISINSGTGERTYHKSDGTLIGDDTDLPLGIADLTQVYDGTTSESWIWDLKYINSQPTCVFTVFPSHGTSSHEYWRGRWNGSSWDTEKICDAGTTATADYLYTPVGDVYSGGITLDDLDEDIVYVSREFGTGDFRIHKVEKSGSWTVGTWLSEGSPGVNARPVAITSDGASRVFWWSGRYTTYLDYSTVVMAHPAPQEAGPPSNSVAPAVTGTEANGKTLSCTTGTWTGSPTYAYQWYSNSAASSSGGTAISGATSSTYVVADSLADLYIYCVVTATNGEGSDSEPSNVTGQILGLNVVVKANPTFADVADFDQETLFNEAIGDDGTGEEMPAPTTWNTDSPVGDIDWSAFTLAVDANAINRSNRAGATLISPNYVVLAQHAPGDNTGHTWMTPAGAEVTRTLGETLDVDYWEFSGSDLALAKLSAPINNITPMPMILDSSKIAGRGCLVLEMDRHLNAYVVPGNLTNADISVNVYQDPGTDYIESGDSGKPVTIIIDDTAVMVMTAMFASSIDGSRYIGLGPNASHFIDELFAIMAEDGESPTVWDLVISSGGREPSSASEFASAISCTNFPYYL